MSHYRETSSDPSVRIGPATTNSVVAPTETGIAMGKKVGLFGIGLLVLGSIFLLTVMYFTGYFAPLGGTEGVGP